jgi:hypothetical protein
MPRVTIKTGIVEEDGQEAVLSEHLCDWPDCANIAEHVVGVARDAAWACAVCAEHFAEMKSRASQSEER